MRTEPTSWLGTLRLPIRDSPVMSPEPLWNRNVHLLSGAVEIDRKGSTYCELWVSSPLLRAWNAPNSPVPCSGREEIPPFPRD